MVVLIWVYYSAQILFLGAEFTQVYAKSFGSRIEPAENAVAVTEDARAQQGMPRKELGEETGMERQVGGVDTYRTPASQTAARAMPEHEGNKASPGAVVGFFLGLLLGRRQRPKH